jgi:hypothetical protein
MRNPDDRSPAEWAEEARERRDDARNEAEPTWMNAWPLSVWDCTELADRMDDLEEAIKVLSLVVAWPFESSETADDVPTRISRLLARYEEDGQ